MIRTLAICLFACLTITPIFARQSETGFLDRTVVVDESVYKYQVYVPGNYDSEKSWPVILFLHGAGERGTDGILQTEVGLGSAIRRHTDRYPAVVVFPQARPNTLWTLSSADVAIAALDQTLEDFDTDRNRVYLTGLSLGGHGTWNLAYAFPNRFAAIVPVCGWVEGSGRRPSISQKTEVNEFEEVARRLRGIPTWIYHGDADTVLPVRQSREMFAALTELESPVWYTELPGIGHNSWDDAYRSTELAEWLFQQRRKQP